jgi:2-polyprenyl-3-methyl-5-hydroxy-6-metoxy-1,4-benzoquinol methylase
VSLSGRDAWEANFGPHLPADKAAPILDIGCGLGDFLEYLEQSGYQNLRGVEIDPARVEAARGKTHATIDHSVDLESYLRALPVRFTLITLKSVIAHFPKDAVVAYLRAMRDALAPDGTLIVETFNVSRWTGPYVLYNDATHHWAYTEYSLQQVLEMAGLHVVELRGETLPATRMSTRLFRGTQRAWGACLKAAYFVERGVGRNPAIMTKYLVAVCRPRG